MTITLEPVYWLTVRCGACGREWRDLELDLRRAPGIVCRPAWERALCPDCAKVGAA